MAKRFVDFSSWTITQKAIAIVTIPLLVQLICFAGILKLVNEVEQVDDRDSQFKEAVARINWALASTLLMVNAASQTPQDKTAAKLIDKWTLQSKMEGETAKSLLSTDKTSAVLSEQLDSKFHSLRQEVASASAAGKPGDVQAICFNRMPEILVLRSEILKNHSNVTATASKTAPELRALEKSALCVLAIVDVASALFLIVVFSRGIVERLDVLKSNTTRFSENMPLLSAVTGSDELSQLDGSFRAMVAGYQEAQRRKQDYVSMISHDVRTPLTNLAGVLELLEEGRLGNLSEKGTHTVQRAHRNIDRILKLIKNLLDIERLESGEMQLDLEPVYVSTILQSAQDAVIDIANEQNIRLISDPTDMIIVADKQALEQVLVNLLGNALKFSPANTVVRMCAKPLGGEVEFRVIDQGRGIPENFKEKIFDRFKQVKREDADTKGGAGLGLAICSALVKAHGGTICVESKEGEGSSFIFRIPINSGSGE